MTALDTDLTDARASLDPGGPEPSADGAIPGGPASAGTLPDRPRDLRKRSADDVFSLFGAALGSLTFSWIVYFLVLPFSGVVGFVIFWWAAFLLMYAGVVALANPRPIVVDRVMAAAVSAAAALVGVAVVSVVVYTIAKGHRAIDHGNFYTQSATEAPQAPYNQGGIWNAIAGSGITVGLAILMSLPLGLGTAVFMTEVGGWFAKAVRTVVEAMTAVPDLLAGLFVYVTLILYLHEPKNGLCVSVALAVTMIPIIARSAEVSLRVVPGGLREASLALGASQWQTVRRVVLTTARPGLATALILAVARAIGESAPLLIVSGASDFFTSNPFEAKPMNSLPLYIYEAIRSGQNAQIVRGFGAATVLLAIVFVLFFMTRLLSRQRVTR